MRKKIVKPAPPKRRYRQKGSGSIKKRGDALLLGYNSAPAGATRVFVYETFHGTRTEAENHLRERIAQVKKGGTANVGPKVTFAELAEMFVAAKRISREESTALLYERDLRIHVLPRIGAMKVRAITAAHIDSVLAGALDTSKMNVKKKLPLTSAGRRRLRTLVGSVLEYGLKRDIVAKNVCRQVETPATAYKESTPLSTEDVLTIMAAATGTPIEGIVVVAIGTGMRRGELCGLRVSDVDLESGAYSVSRAVKNVGKAVVVGKVKTKKSNRHDVLPAYALDALRAHRRRQRERHLALGVRVADPHIFDDGTGGPQNPNDVSRRFLDLIRAKGLRPTRFHDLRHAYASLAYAAGVPLKTISESLGHSNIGITSTIYTHLTGGAMAAKSTAIDEFITAARKKAAAKGR